MSSIIKGLLGAVLTALSDHLLKRQEIKRKEELLKKEQAYETAMEIHRNLSRLRRLKDRLHLDAAYRKRVRDRFSTKLDK